MFPHNSLASKVQNNKLPGARYISFIKGCKNQTEVLVPEPVLFIYGITVHATRETILLLQNITLLTNFISLVTRLVYKFQIENKSIPTASSYLFSLIN